MLDRPICECAPAAVAAPRPRRPSPGASAPVHENSRCIGAAFLRMAQSDKIAAGSRERGPGRADGPDTCPGRRGSALVSRFRSSHHCAAHSFANFGIKGTLAIYDSSAVFGFEVPTQTRGYNDRNFKSTALACANWKHRMDKIIKLNRPSKKRSGPGAAKSLQRPSREVAEDAVRTLDSLVRR